MWRGVGTVPMRTFRCGTQPKVSTRNVSYLREICDELLTVWHYVSCVNNCCLCFTVADNIYFPDIVSNLRDTMCEFRELSGPRFRPVICSAALIVSVSGGPISFCGSFLFSPDNSFFLWHSFNTASRFCFSVSTNFPHLCTTILLFYFIWQRYWVCCRCDYGGQS